MMRTLRSLTMAAAVVGALAAPTVALGQDAPPPTARERARESLPAPVFQELERLGSGAEAEGIPPDLLFRKALEGLAKRVPPDRLVPAVESYAGRLVQARAAFGTAVPAPPGLLVAGADALQRGVPDQALRELGGREDRSPMAVLVLADLVETGVPTERALELVGDALQQRTREREMLGIPEQVRRLMRQGRTARDAAEEVRRVIRSGRGGGVGPPVPPGSEPLTEDRQRELRRRLLRGGG